MILLTFIIELFFKNCKHPERYATFVRNIYGQEIIDLNFVRSEWRAKWWPWTLYHDKLYHKDYE